MADLRNELLSKFAAVLNTRELDIITTILDTTLNQYSIAPATYELATSPEYDNFDVLRTFLNIRKLEGRTTSTLLQYKYEITRMFDRVNKHITLISTEDIRGYLAYYRSIHHVSMTTLDNMRSCLSSFFKWCFQEGYIKSNPTTKITPFKRPKKPVRAYSDVELEKLRCNCTSVRDRALIEFLFSSGCRVSECSNLNIEDFNMTDKSVIINHGKGNKAREVFVSNTTLMWLEKYVTEFRGTSDGAFWVGKRGRLTADGIEYIVSKIGERANVHATPHKFRHSLCTKLLQLGCPIQAVAEMLGHEQISTTMVYADVNKADIKHLHETLIR